MTSVIFPGQGSQFVGMAKDFNDNFEISKLLFEEIEDSIKVDIRNIIFNNQDKKLDLTQFTQISIFACSYVIFKTYLNEKNLKINDFNIMLGHSLGEYTALACSNKISLEQCSKILIKRGELMNNAVAPNETGMAALIGKNSDYINKIINDNNLSLQIANDNSPIQIVVSGSKKEILSSKNIFLDNDIKRFVELNVSAAFHSDFMLTAQEELSKEIEKINFKQNDTLIISNYDATINQDTISIKNKLQKQMANKVNWTQSIKNLEEIGDKKILEIGPSKVLSGLINRISKNFDITSINQVSDL